MSKFRRKPDAEAPQRDPRAVAVACPVPGGFELVAARREASGIRVQAIQRIDAGAAGAADWFASHRVARTVVALPGEQVIVRAVQLPGADEQRLLGALELNASTFVLGRTPAWRVAAALLPGSRGEGLRTGLVAEWTEEAGRPALPAGIMEGADVSFAPSIAGLAALAGMTSDPLVHVDAGSGVLSVCVPTSAGLLARTVRTARDGGRIAAQDVAQAVGEACVHAGVAGNEIPAAIGRAMEAAASVLGGGFGCTRADLGRLVEAIPAPEGGDEPAWWREHGLAAGLAAAALGPVAALTRMQSSDLGARPDRAAAVLNRLSEPRTARRLVIAGLLAVVLGPLALEGARLLMLRWKLPDLQGYLKAEDVDRRKQAMYRALGRQGASMTKTLSDLACCAPDGVELDFINVTQSAKGQAVSVRGKARPAGKLQGTEVILEMERQLRESGAFEAIQRSSDPPDARGYQAFSLGATAVRPTYVVAFPESQDFAKVSMRERRYGPPPDDVDPAASGLGAGWKPGVSEGNAGGPARSDHATAPAPTDGEVATTADAGAPRTNSSARTAGGAAASAGRTSARQAPAHDVASTSAARGDGAKPDGAVAASDAAAPAEDPKSARATRGGASRAGLATRSNPGSTSTEAEAPPPAITENEVNRMSREEARDWLVKVSKARHRADLDTAVQERLKREFDLLIERCKRE